MSVRRDHQDNAEIMQVVHNDASHTHTQNIVIYRDTLTQRGMEPTFTSPSMVKVRRDGKSSNRDNKSTGRTIKPREKPF